MSSAPTGPQASAMIARLAYKRLFRARSFWVSLCLLGLPLLLTGLGDDPRVTWDRAYGALIALLAVIPPIHLASAIADEVDDQTFTYLWSRPLPRWSLVAGKLGGLGPAVAIGMAGMAALLYALTVAKAGGDTALLARSTGAIALGALAAGMVSVGLGSVVPRHPLATAVAYLLVVDSILGSVPFAINVVSLSYNVRVIAGLEAESQYSQAARMIGINAPPDPVVAALWMLGVATAFLGLALWRVRKTEYAAKK